MRLPKVDTDDLILCLLEHQKEVEQSLHHSSATIWKTVSNHFSGKITPKAVYTFVNQNRSNCLDVLKIDSPLKQTREWGISEDSDSSGDMTMGYELKLDLSFWTKIIPKSNERFLQKGWTDVISGLLMASRDLNECIWAFKCGYMLADRNTQSLKLKAQCTECLGTIVARDFKVLDDGVLVIFDVSSIDKGKHTGKYKRHLTGERRLEIGKALSSIPPANFQRNNAVDLIETDPKLRSLPNLETLRKCKEEFNSYDKDQVNTASKQAAIEKLHILQFTLPYQTAIHHLSLCKFDLKYWSREQLVTYNAYVRDCKDVPSKLAVDATGGVVKKLSRPHNSRSGNIFLYSAVIHSTYKHGQIPVSQMLSESHSTESIANWLLLWKRQGALVPKTVVCDHSLALLGALCWAFNQMYLKHYLKHMFILLRNAQIRNLRPTDGDLPECFIRVDYAHVIKIVSSWESMKKKPRRFREFYLHAMSILIRCERLEESEKLIKALFILANSEFVGKDSNGNETPAQMSRNYLAQLIAKIQPIDLEHLETTDAYISQAPRDETENDRDITDHSNAINEWIDNLLRDILSECGTVTVDDNFHYCPAFAKDLARFLKTLLLWSAVLVPVFNYGNPTESSSCVESYFNDLKNRTFANKQLPLRVDKFFVKHYRAIQGMMIISSSEKEKEVRTGLANPIKLPPGDDQSEELSEPEEECNENWRGLGKSPKKRRTAYYGVACLEVLTLQTEKKIKIPLLKNLNQSRTPLTFAKEKYLIDNSCPFDSVFQALAAGYCDSLEMRQMIDEDEENVMFRLVKSLMKDGTKPVTLKLRMKS